MPVYLADSSIWGWARGQLRMDISMKLAERLERDEVATCYPVAMEHLHRARTGAEYEAIFAELFEPLRWVPVGRNACTRAFEVQRDMARTKHGNHRRPAVDYLVAAAAELAGDAVMLWAFDRDLSVICEHTRQAHESETA